MISQNNVFKLTVFSKSFSKNKCLKFIGFLLIQCKYYLVFLVFSERKFKLSFWDHSYVLNK